MSAVLWVVAAALIAIGVVGTVLPALPGVLFVFGGILLAAWIDDFARISAVTVIVCGVLAAVGTVIDYVAAAWFAQRSGASRAGLVGASVGTLLGVFGGLAGLLLLPLLGAAIGEFLARRDALRAGRVGLATWLGLLVGAVAKIALVFAMIGWFIAALLIP